MSDESDYGGIMPFTAELPSFHTAPVAITPAAYVPYKYIIRPKEGKLYTFTRSTCGRNRRLMQRDVKSWSYIKLPDAEADPERTTTLLKEELSTDGVTYDKTFRAFRIEPSEAVTHRVREIAQQITPAAFTTYSIISSLGRRFFSQMDANAAWLEPAEDEEPPSMEDLTSTARATIRTVIWTAINNRIVAFVESPPPGSREAVPTVNIWTTHSSLAKNKQLAALAAASVACGSRFASDSRPPVREDSDDDEPIAPFRPNLEIKVRHFESTQDLIDEIEHSIETNYDVAVHYGDESSDQPIAAALRKIRALDDVHSSADIFDLRDYVENVYTDMSSHTFRSVVTEISIIATNEEGLPCTASDAVASGAMGVFSTGDEERQDAFVSRFSSGELPHTEENLIYLIKNVAARAFLMGRLYAAVSKMIYNLMYLSGCNMSTLTQREHCSRGVVSFIDAMAAYSQIVDTLPHDYMEPGVHALTQVTPFSSILISSMIDSPDQTTSVIGSMIAPLRGYGWLVREIFSLRSLRPLPPPDIPSVFGIFRGMVYSTEQLEGHAPERGWSSIIYVGLGSWIGITFNELPGDDFTAANENGGISFGYFGIEEVCRHPFDAVRIAVETYLSLSIRSNAATSPRAVVQSMVTGKVLNDENMAVRRCITAENLRAYISIVPEHERRPIAAGEKTLTMSMWYREDGQSFTTNPVLADKRVYSRMLEYILTRVFVPIVPIPAPPLILEEPPQSITHGFVSVPPPAVEEEPPRPPPHRESRHEPRLPPAAQHQPHIAIVQARAPERGIFRSIVHPHSRASAGGGAAPLPAR